MHVLGVAFPDPLTTVGRPDDDEKIAEDELHHPADGTTGTRLKSTVVVDAWSVGVWWAVGGAQRVAVTRRGAKARMASSGHAVMSRMGHMGRSTSRMGHS
jgi:hypothetical protein